jgi:ligand-binding SRPBCC domain-containing protein
MDASWTFFSNPLNLSKITPPWLNFRVTSEAAAEIYPGMTITYRITPFAGIETTWVSEITHVNAPLYFVDEQRLGPFRFWHHQHLFTEVSRGTEMRDTVHYAMPLGPVGDLVLAGFVRRKVESIFDFRERTLERIFS